MSDFLMPSLGADMELAVLVEWLVKPGAQLKAGDLIAVVETDKGAIDLEVFEDCEVESLLVEPGTTVKVDGVLARLRVAGESAAAPAVIPSVPQTPSPVMAAATTAFPADAQSTLEHLPPAAVGPLPAGLAAASAPASAPPMSTAEGSVRVSEAGGRVRASPAARSRAAGLGIKLAGLRGSGPGGAILLADLAAPGEAAPTSSRRGFDPAAMRRAIAAAVSRAKREIPHYYLTQTLSLAAAMAWLASENAKRPVTERLLPAVLLLKASALALRKHGAFTGHYLEGGFRQASAVHIGWAISLRGGGLIAPAIHDVDQLDLFTLMTTLRDLVQRARGGGLRGSELRDATITITSLGDRSADTVLPIIHPPQVAMLGFGSLVQRPWITEDGGLAPQPVVTLTLAADHRVSDGHEGGRLLATIAHHLTMPESL